MLFSGNIFLSILASILIGGILGFTINWLYEKGFLTSKVGIFLRISLAIILAIAIIIHSQKHPFYYQNQIIKTDFARIITALILGLIIAIAYVVTMWKYKKK